jgi:hypothetical protein
MPLREQVVGLFRRFGAPVRFAVRTVLSSAIPGGGAVVDLIDSVLDCAHETAKDQYRFDDSRMPMASSQELERVELVLGQLATDMPELLQQMVALKDTPDQARQAIELARQNNQHIQRSFARLDESVQILQRIEANLAQSAHEARELHQQILTRLDQISFSWIPLVPTAKTHNAEISRRNPTCLLILVDQSKSMRGTFGLPPQTRKADAVVAGINGFLEELVIKCARAEGIRDYFRIGVIGYGQTVGPAWQGKLAGKNLVSIPELADNVFKVEEYHIMESDGAGGQIKRKKKRRVWVEPAANGKTPMGKAVGQARDLVSKFVREFPNCFPPIVLNFTDGEPTDDPTKEAETLRGLSSSNGSVLLFNAHLSSRDSQPIQFPRDESQLPDDLARKMFRMSSAIPDSLVGLGQTELMPVAQGSRGFVFNADLRAVLAFLNIGTTITRNVVRK